MLDFKASNRRSAKNETSVAEQFKKWGYLVKKLDRKSSKGRRPDFLISNSAGVPQMLCELKTVDSAFYPHDKRIYGVEHVHISTFDDEFQGQFQNIPIDLSKIDDRLADAVLKRKALVEDEPTFANLPLLVAFFFDFYAEYLPFYPRSFDERDKRFREVSGILMIGRNVARNKASNELSCEEQERRARAEFEGNAEVNDDLPPNSTDFVLVPNKAAIRKVPADFESQCTPYGNF